MVLGIWRGFSCLEAGKCWPNFQENFNDSGNYRSVSLTSVPGKITDKIILESSEILLKDNTVIIGHSQHGFMKEMSCLSKLISFYDKVTHLTDQRKPVDIIFFYFSKVFYIVSHRMLLDKISITQLDKHIM